MGLDGVPIAGEEFDVYKSENEAGPYTGPLSSCTLITFSEMRVGWFQ